MYRIQRMVFLTAMSMLMATSGSVMGQTPAGPEFTYQGQLQDGGQPANGTYDMEFSLYGLENGGSPVEPAVIANAVEVENGRFTVELDFGFDAFNGDKRWLLIVVDGTPLSPRQKITATPYATKTRGIYSDANENIGIGLDLPEAPIHIQDGSAGNVEAGNNASAIFERSTTNYVKILSPGNTQRGVFFGDAEDSGNGSIIYNNANVPDGFQFRTGGNDIQMVIDSDGYVGVGRDNSIVPNISYFDIQTPAGNNTFGGMYIATDSETGIPFYGYAAGGTTDMFTYYNGGVDQWGVRMGQLTPMVVNGSNSRVGLSTLAPEFLLHVNGDAGKPGGGPWSAASDRRLKKNIEDLDGSLDKLLKLRGVTFEYKDPKAIHELEGQRIGMIAQEVEKVFPDWVDKKDNGYKTLTPRGFEALAVEALRELRDEKDGQIRDLDEQVQELEQENEELRDRLNALEAAVSALTSQN